MCLDTAYFAEIENLFSKNTIDKGKSCWGPFVESPMERKAQWWGPQEIDYE